MTEQTPRDRIARIIAETVFVEDDPKLAADALLAAGLTFAPAGMTAEKLREIADRIVWHSLHHEMDSAEDANAIADLRAWADVLDSGDVLDGKTP